MSEKDVKIDYDNFEIMIAYSNEVAYIGQIDPDQFEDASEGISIYKPYVINVRPVTNEQDGNKLEAVVLDIMLPLEFAGLPLTEQLYSGFVNFSQSQVDLQHGKSTMMDVDGGGRISINRVASLADINDPFIWVKVNKLIKPSDDLIKIYKVKVAQYNELLASPRMVDLQAMIDESIKTGFDMNPDTTNGIDLTGNLIH